MLTHRVQIRMRERIGVDIGPDGFEPVSLKPRERLALYKAVKRRLSMSGRVHLIIGVSGTRRLASSSFGVHTPTVAPEWEGRQERCRSLRSLREAPLTLAGYQLQLSVMPKTDGLWTALHGDLLKVYKDGLDPAVEPRRFPALAGLAETASKEKYNGRSEYYGVVIEALLRRAIDASVPTLIDLLPRSETELRDGLRELLGIGKERVVRGRGARRENAAPLLGSKNGEALRKAERRNTKVTDLILADIADQLVLIARAYNYTFSRPLTLPGRGTIPLNTIKQKHTLPDGDRALKAYYLGRTLYDELNTIIINGLTDTNLSEIPILAALAYRATHTKYDSSEFSKEDIEEVITWAVDGITNSEHRAGALELFSLGNEHEPDSYIRLDRAAIHFGYASTGEFVSSYKAAWVYAFVRDNLVILAGEMDFWPEMGEVVSRARVLGGSPHTLHDPVGYWSLYRNPGYRTG